MAPSHTRLLSESRGLLESSSLSRRDTAQGRCHHLLSDDTAHDKVTPLTRTFLMPRSHTVKIETDVPLMMRDGTITHADVFRPDAPGRFPALLSRTPYDKSSAGALAGGVNPIAAVMKGYAAVVQDVRGMYTSGGEFYTFVNEIDDGYDSVEWVAGQPWCNGKVGMWGSSYLGATQWLAAKAKPPSLAAIAPGVTASDYHEGWTWQGGAFELGFNLTWIYPSLTADNWENLSSRLHLPEGKLSELIDARDSLRSGFEHLPLKRSTGLAGRPGPLLLRLACAPRVRRLLEADLYRGVPLRDHRSGP